MRFEDLMAALAETLGARDGFTPDEDGTVTLEMNGVTFSFLEQTDYPVPGHAALLMWGRFDGLTSENADALAAEMLRANDRPDDPGGPTLSLLDEMVCLQQTLSLDLLDAETLARESDAFIGALMDWHKRVLEYRGPADGAAEESLPMDGMFLRV